IACSGRSVSTGEFIEIQADATISHVDPLFSPPETGIWISPGFIDIQVNGFAGADFNSPETSFESIERAIRAILVTGVTRFFPTVIAGSPERMLGALRNLARARQSVLHGEAMEAFHVEGPHISAEDGPRGAHPREWVRPPDFDEFQRWQEAAEGQVRLVTLS